MKKIITIIGLLLVIVSSIAWIIYYLNRGPQMPPAVRISPEERIDQYSAVLITRTIGQWERLGQRNGKYKNPETGEYTMVTPFECTMCGAKIPPADIPLEYTVAQPDPESRIRVLGAVGSIRGQYICPKCGERAYAREGMTGLQAAIERWQQSQRGNTPTPDVAPADSDSEQ